MIQGNLWKSWNLVTRLRLLTPNAHFWDKFFVLAHNVSCLLSKHGAKHSPPGRRGRPDCPSASVSHFHFSCQISACFQWLSYLQMTSAVKVSPWETRRMCQESMDHAGSFHGEESSLRKRGSRISKSWRWWKIERLRAFQVMSRKH